MKKLMFLLISSVMLLTACSKSSDEAPVPKKDYSAALKGKVWVGSFTSVKAADYYTVQFNADNTLVWSVSDGDFKGVWAVDSQRVNITLAVSGKQFSAGITDDDKLVNISYPVAKGWVVNTAELCPNANMVLDNTVWKGTSTAAFGGKPHPLALPDPYSISFKPGLNLQASYGGLLKYSRVGASIRFKPSPGIPGWFGVLTADGKKIKGVQAYGEPWEVTKQ